MDYIGWISLGMTVAANIALMAWQWSQISSKIDAMEGDIEETKNELKELRSLKTDIHVVKEVLVRLEQRFNTFFDNTMRAYNKDNR